MKTYRYVLKADGTNHVMYVSDEVLPTWYISKSHLMIDVKKLEDKGYVFDANTKCAE